MANETQTPRTNPTGELPVSAHSEAAPQVQEVVRRIALRVAELPDRDSPEDWPEAMLVTHEELIGIVTDELEADRDALCTRVAELEAENERQRQQIRHIEDFVPQGVADLAAEQAARAVAAESRLAQVEKALDEALRQIEEDGYWTLSDRLRGVLDAPKAALSAPPAPSPAPAIIRCKCGAGTVAGSTCPECGEAAPSRSQEPCPCPMCGFRREYGAPAPTPEAPPARACGKNAGNLIAGAVYFSCVLPEDHEGEHKKGGMCFTHGPYVERCPSCQPRKVNVTWVTPASESRPPEAQE